MACQLYGGHLKSCRRGASCSCQLQEETICWCMSELQLAKFATWNSSVSSACFKKKYFKGRIPLNAFYKQAWPALFKGLHPPPPNDIISMRCHHIGVVPTSCRNSPQIPLPLKRYNLAALDNDVNYYSALKEWYQTNCIASVSLYFEQLLPCTIATCLQIIAFHISLWHPKTEAPFLYWFSKAMFSSPKAAVSLQFISYNIKVWLLFMILGLI